MKTIILLGAGALVLAVLCAPGGTDRPALPEAKAKGSTNRITFERDDQAGQLYVLLDGHEAFAYRYGDDVDLPHLFPVRSPSGHWLTIEQTKPYPHHRSLWFADTVRLAGHRRASFYNAFYTSAASSDPKAPFRDHIRHKTFSFAHSAENHAELCLTLLWEMDRTVPVLDEVRQMRVVALEAGQYLLDLTFTLTASYGDVTFESDAVHYAWPFVRMNSAFSVGNGATITNSEGGLNQAGTNNQRARWVDYANTVRGQTEGLALFSHPDNGPPPRWLTREYGTFGPRRPDEQSGKPFTLKKGEHLRQRVGILVHRGDTEAGRVAERYALYAAGKL